MRKISLTGACVVAILVACSPAGSEKGQAAAPGNSAGARGARTDSAADRVVASITVKSSDGRDLGTLTASDVGDALSLVGTLRGLPPGVHGVHVHMVGSCDGPAFTSAGAHWNPASKEHGSENPKGPHLGDMNNITVGADSSANVQISTHGGTMSDAVSAMMDSDGASLVVHASADDYRTDPSGNSGDRIACGVIGKK